jgi:hypothetical protein
MSEGNFLKNTQIVILGVCIAAATVAASLIFSKGLLEMKKFSTEVISVTGSAEKKIVSDLIVWRAEFSRRNIDLVIASALLKEDLKTVKDYLVAKGIDEKMIVVLPVDTRILYKKNEKGNDLNEIEGYQLTQRIEIKSQEVEKIGAVSRASTELIDKGIQFISNAPDYFYTKLAELKLAMLSEATQDAKKRAEKMAAATGNKVGFMRSAKMGVFQITPVNSLAVSDWGENDTTSYEKRVTGVVRADFAIKE